MLLARADSSPLLRPRGSRQFCGRGLLPGALLKRAVSGRCVGATPCSPVHLPPSPANFFSQGAATAKEGPEQAGS